MLCNIKRKIKNAFYYKDDKQIPDNLKNWFQIEYGKNWKMACDHYMKTGSVHFYEK